MDPSLYKAARSGEINFLERLTVDQETRYFSQLTPRNNTVVHVAAEFKQAEFMKRVCLKCNTSQIWQQNSRHETPLHVAARVGCIEIVRFLTIEQESCYVSDINQGRRQNGIRKKNRDGDTALNCAVRYGHKDVVEFLLEKDPDLSSFSSYVDESPLYLAVANSFIDIAMLIIRLSPHSFSHLGPKGLTPLHAALSGIFPSTRDSNKVLEMMEEVIKKRPEMIKEADDIGWTTFHYAALGNIEALKLLLKYELGDASAAYQLDHDGNSALHVAACWGTVSVMKELIQSCPDILELSNKKGQTALHLAVINNRIAVVRYILRDPKLAAGLLNEPDEDGNTPLHLAVLYDQKQIIQSLAKDKRVNINAINKDFKAAAHIYFLSYRKPGFTTLKFVSLFKESNMIQYAQHFARDVAKEWLNRTPELKPQLLGHKEARDRRKKSYTKYPEIYLLVGTIITTVSFSAFFTVPGGYITEGHEKGKPILADKAAFKAFVILDIIAFCFSLSAVFIQQATAISEQMRVRYQRIQTGFIGTAMIALAFAFALGIYVTLENSNLGLSYTAYVMLCCLLLIFCALWCIDPFGGRSLIQARWAIGKYRIQLFRARAGRLLPVCTCSVDK